MDEEKVLCTLNSLKFCTDLNCLLLDHFQRIAILVGCILIGGGVIFYFLNDARQVDEGGVALPPLEENLKSTKTSIDVPLVPICSSSEKLQSRMQTL